ncbi:hypothetical protein O162_04710 [Pseudomonas putida SJ3]|nr:hypothetical protein L483_00330 [Pseudomonas putida H8234]ERT19614.1 hypothetical protein O162_04710 [Pseudomonas putida SJ3]PNA98912.1 hypothetical protein C1X74_10250 [Pseudomonas sp. GW460-5]PNB61419.1 hypothetical protein C1X73_05730 [Pseudomonas sp. FW305-130]
MTICQARLSFAFFMSLPFVLVVMAPDENARDKAIGQVTGSKSSFRRLHVRTAQASDRALVPAKKAATIAMAKGEI